MGCRCNCATYREHLLGVKFAPSALGSADARGKNDMEARWQKDIPAYRRLRKSGLQPPMVDGSANLEARANSPYEVETGQIVSEADRVEVDAISRDLPSE
jgi:hypothetical protein